MKEKPILFSAPMVQAILAGTKTQTRRIFKGTTEHKGEYNPAYIERWEQHSGWAKICPYGGIGDHLWVRETWTQDGRGGQDAQGRDAVYYRADMPHHDTWAGTWKPSIFMPRWASRITLEITDIRVEYLQSISEEDAQAEGVQPIYNPHGGSTITPYWHGFRELWSKINGKESWDNNPLVWAISFRKV